MALRPLGVLQNWDLSQYTVKDMEENCRRGLEHLKGYAEQAANPPTFSYETVLKVPTPNMYIFITVFNYANFFKTKS
jgi:hypothetical protein